MYIYCHNGGRYTYEECRSSLYNNITLTLYSPKGLEHPWCIRT